MTYFLFKAFLPYQRTPKILPLMMKPCKNLGKSMLTLILRSLSVGLTKELSLLLKTKELVAHVQPLLALLPLNLVLPL